MVVFWYSDTAWHLSGLADSSPRLALARRRFLPIDSGFARAELMNAVGAL